MPTITIKGPCLTTCDDCATGPCTCTAPDLTNDSATATAGTPFTYTITPTNSPTPTVSFMLFGSLPSGLSFNSSTGQITGTAHASYSGSFTMVASNCCGSDSASLTLTVNEPTCPSPTLVCDSISATKTKDGFPAFSGNKYYLTSTLSDGTSVLRQKIVNPGNALCNQAETDSDELRYSGSTTYDPATDTYSGAGARGVDRYQGGAFVTRISLLTDSICDTVANQAVCGVALSKCACIAISSTEQRVIGDGNCYGPSPDHISTGYGVDQLSSEYTTAALVSNTAAALPSYPGTWTGDCSAIRDIDSDELSCLLQSFKYKFTLPTMPTGTTGYTINWVERFTPAGGGSPTDTARSYTWNGTDTETSVYTVGYPGSNGTITIEDVTVDCDF